MMARIMTNYNCLVRNLIRNLTTDAARIYLPSHCFQVQIRKRMFRMWMQPNKHLHRIAYAPTASGVPIADKQLISETHKCTFHFGNVLVRLSLFSNRLSVALYSARMRYVAIPNRHPHMPPSAHKHIIQNTIRNYLQHFGQVTIYMRLLRPRDIDTYPTVVPRTHPQPTAHNLARYSCISSILELKYVTHGDGAPKREIAMCHAWRTCQRGLSILVASP